MSGEPQGLATFPGVDQVTAWRVSLTHGVTPSVFTLDTAPQDDFAAANGAFGVTFGDVAFTFSNCKVEQAIFHAGPKGMIWTLTILDRRWMWQGLGLLSGAYNLRGGDNSLRADAIVKTLPQLLSLCLDALNEAGYDVGDAPSAGNPTVVWDSVQPADALADLCDQYGLRVVLRSDDTVKICVVGQGQTLPIDDNVMENGLAIDPPRRPAQTAIVCARNRYQVDLPLQPIAADVDGSLKPIDQLSYAPADGWPTVDLVDFFAVDAGSRALARRWVFRAYQVTAPFAVAEFGQVNKLDQVLPIEAEQVALQADAQGDSTNAPAIVFGQFFTDGELAANNAAGAPADFNNVPAGAIYNRPFVIDRQRGIVWFREQVFSNQNTGVPLIPIAAKLYLRVAIGVRDPNTGAWTRYTRTRGGQPGPATLYKKHDEITYAVTPTYNGQAVAGSANNAAGVNAQCDALLDAIDYEFSQTFPQTIKYAGIQPIELDGAIQQIVWQGGPRGATTIASHNQESHLAGPSHAERRAGEAQRRLKDLLRFNKPALLELQLKNSNIA